MIPAVAGGIETATGDGPAAGCSRSSAANGSDWTAETGTAMMAGSGSTDGLGGNEDLEALQGVKKFPVRVKCALLPWTALLEIIERWETAGKPVAAD